MREARITLHPTIADALAPFAPRGSTLSDKIAAQRAAKRERYARVMRCEEVPPPCFTCKAPSTHVTDGVTPAGYHAWQCAEHASVAPRPLWGSDPGWESSYVLIEDARRAAIAKAEGRS